MFRKINVFLHKLEVKLASASLLILGLSLVTKFLGFVKLRMIANTFGASRELDIFWASFVIPDLIFMLIIGGSVNAALIPAFVRLKKQGFKKLRQVFNLVLFLTGVLWPLLWLGLIVILHFSAPALASFVMFGLKTSSHVGKLGLQSGYYLSIVNLYKNLTIIMFIGSMFLALSSVIGAFLLSYKRFVVNNISPLLYNLGPILGIVFMQIFHTVNVYVLAWSVVFGAFLHFLVQFIYLLVVYKDVLSKFPKDVYFVFKHRVLAPLQEVRHIFTVALPRMFGIGVEQISVFFNTFWALFLGAGALTIYKIALSLHYLPIHLIGNSIAQAFFPSLNENKEGDKRSVKLNGEFTRLFHRAFFMVFLLTGYIALVIFIMKTPIVTVLMAGKRFTRGDVYLTSLTLGALSLSIVLNALLPLVLRVFYVLEETKTPFLISVMGVIMNIIFGIALANLFGHPIVVNSIKQILWNFNFKPFLHLVPHLPVLMLRLARGKYSIVGLALGLGFGTLPELLLAIKLAQKRVKTLFSRDFINRLGQAIWLFTFSGSISFLIHKGFVHAKFEEFLLGIFLEFVLLTFVILLPLIWYNRKVWQLKFTR